MQGRWQLSNCAFRISSQASLQAPALPGTAKRHVRRDRSVARPCTNSPAEVDAPEIVREPLWTDQRGDHGPFDIVGDIYGCFCELTALLARLGYRFDPYQPGESLLSARHSQGRRVQFLCDITDRGPRNVDCPRLVRGICSEGTAQCVMGNHDFNLFKFLKRHQVKLTHRLGLTAGELAPYVNFYFCNGGVIGPLTGEAPDKDQEALTSFSRLFPDREVVGATLRAGPRQGVAIHYMTMQVPVRT